jgi:MoxR-like ATPase
MMKAQDRQKQLSPAEEIVDAGHLATLVANKAGVSPDEAQKRVDAYVQSLKEAADRAKAAADEARKTAAKASLYTALALLIGAFIASVSAALGGRCETNTPEVQVSLKGSRPTR